VSISPAVVARIASVSAALSSGCVMSRTGIPVSSSTHCSGEKTRAIVGSNDPCSGGCWPITATSPMHRRAVEAVELDPGAGRQSTDEPARDGGIGLVCRGQQRLVAERLPDASERLRRHRLRHPRSPRRLSAAERERVRPEQPPLLGLAACDERGRKLLELTDKHL